MNRIVSGSFIFFGISVALFGVVRFPLAQVLLERYHADAVWWSFPVSSVLSAILAALYYRYGGWRHAHMLSAVTR